VSLLLLGFYISIVYFDYLLFSELPFIPFFIHHHPFQVIDFVFEGFSSYLIKNGITCFHYGCISLLFYVFLSKRLVWPQFANYNSTLLILGKFSQTGKC
jgi:hypothetical protein